MAVSRVTVDGVDAALEEEGHDRQAAEHAQGVLENPADAVLRERGGPQLVQHSIAQDARHGQLDEASLAGPLADDTQVDTWVNRHRCGWCRCLLDVV